MIAREIKPLRMLWSSAFTMPWKPASPNTFNGCFMGGTPVIHHSQDLFFGFAHQGVPVENDAVRLSQESVTHGLGCRY